MQPLCVPCVLLSLMQKQCVLGGEMVELWQVVFDGEVKSVASVFIMTLSSWFLVVLWRDGKQ